jgi:hypothetical protein
MDADSQRQASDRLILMTLDECGGNVSAAWRQLSTTDWHLPSLSTFRRRVSELTAMHPVAPPPITREQPIAARTATSSKQTESQAPRGNVLVVAIDIAHRDVIRSWLIPSPSRHDPGIETTIREGLALRSHLMLDLSEFASHGNKTR